MADATFHGVDVGWMQAQWRDCADKPAQLKIFRNMCGKKATVQQILEVVGEPEYCGPEAPAKRTYERYTKEDEEQILRLAAEGATNKTIADALGKSEGSIAVKITAMREKGIEVRRGKKAEEKAVERRAEAFTPESVPAQYPDGSALPLELGEFPGKNNLEAVDITIRALLDEEEMLCDRLRIVQNTINEYRHRLSDLLALAGGGLGTA